MIISRTFSTSERIFKMSNDVNLRGIGPTAQALSKNPLGIIALFIVLVYGFASMVTAFGGNLSESDRTPLIYFLIIFPVLVLGVFTWLVSKHYLKLYGPSDFKDENNYVKMQMAAVASLSAATVKDHTSVAHFDVKKLIEIVQETGRRQKYDIKANHILWVDDRPNNNIYERRAFEAIGLKFSLAKSTDEAFDKLRNSRFSAIISDMGRKEGPHEGYVLLDRLRKKNDNTPLFFYASSNAPEHKRETIEHGGQGCTNDPKELFQMVTRNIIQQQVA